MRNRPANGRAPDFAAPFCAGGRDMSPNNGAVEHLNQMSGLAGLRQDLKKRLENARSAEPPEPLPDAVPVSEFPRQRSPCDVVDREIMQGFQKPAVVVARFTAARLHSVEHLQNDRPVLLRHSRQHGRLPVAGHASIRRKGDSGIPLPDTWPYPSTRPRIRKLLFSLAEK